MLKIIKVCIFLVLILFLNNIDSYASGETISENYLSNLEGKLSKENSEDMLQLAFIILMDKKLTPVDYARAIELLERSSELGNSDASRSLSIRYGRGEYVEKNCLKSLFYHIKAAYQGVDGTFFYILGTRYLTGDSCISKDKKKAIDFFVKSSEQGNKLASWALGTMYAGRDERERLDSLEDSMYDQEKAKKWFDKAAEQCDTGEYKFNVGFQYFSGEQGISYDPAKAAKLFKEASDLGHSDASDYLSSLYYRGEGVEQSDAKGLEYSILSAKQDQTGREAYYLGKFHYCDTLKDYEKALYWLEYGSKLGDWMCSEQLCYMYEEGLGVEVDYDKGLYYAELSARQNSSGWRAYHLAKSYYDEEPKDYKSGLYWLEYASNLGNSSSSHELSRLYNEGVGVKKDKAKGLYYLSLYAEQRRDNEEMVRLGQKYFNGDGVIKNYSKATEWFKKALEIDADTAAAKYYLGVIYYKGLGVDKDETLGLKFLKEATELFRRAVRADKAAAKYYLGIIYYKGLGVDKDKTFGLELLKEAAADGNKDAIKFLSK